MSRSRRARNKARAADAAQVQITDKFHPNRSKCERVSCGAPEQRRSSYLRADARWTWSFLGHGPAALIKIPRPPLAPDNSL